MTEKIHLRHSCGIKEYARLKGVIMSSWDREEFTNMALLVQISTINSGLLKNNSNRLELSAV